jgi:hypothetical protein
MGRKRLLETGRRLSVGRACEGLGAGLTEVGNRLLPQLAPDGVVGQPLDLFGWALGVKRLDGVDDPGVERAPAVLEHASVGDLGGEHVLEGVLEIREEPRLVEELGGLEVGEAAA